MYGNNDEPYNDKSENIEKRTIKKVELFRAPFSKINCFVCKKEQLVAIYRYWIKKGLDHSTLSLLKCNSS
jgi:hypothetical protein